MICGPIVSTSDLDAQTALYSDCFGLQANDVFSLTTPECGSLFGLADRSIKSRWLAVPGTSFGVRLWAFDPPAGETVRDPMRGTDRDAPKVVDFYAPDFDQAVNHLANMGHNVKSSIAEYSISDGTMREAHLWGPDNVVSAVISGPETFFNQFATVRDRIFSEPQSISSPVSDLGQALRFYKEVFGLSTVYEYSFEHSSFDALVGTDTPLQLNAANVGTSTREPYLGLIDYGGDLPGSVSLKGKAQPPARGLVGVELMVEDIDDVIKRVNHFEGATILGRAAFDDFPPHGKTRTLLVEAPHGVLHHVIEKVTAAD